MKNIICYILIPAFLAQTVGCFSMRDIRAQELNDFKDQKLYLKTNDSSEYIMVKGSDDLNISNWEVSNDSLILRTDKLYRYSRNENIIVKELSVVPFSSISQISFREFSLGTTTLTIVSSLLILTALAISSIRVEPGVN